MLPRNLFIIALSATISWACYEKAQQDRYVGTLTRAMSLIEDEYVQPIDQHELFEAAMDGMVGNLDEYSEFITQQDYSQFQESLDQKFGGVGIVVEINPKTKRITVMSPLAGTPAWKAGMLAGDTIMKIEGQSTEKMTLQDAVDIMRGEPGSEVSIQVLRVTQGKEELLDFSMNRAVILVESVLGDTRQKDGQWNFFLEENPRIGYIRLTTFGDRTVDELEDALKRMGDEVDGLILDLRDNAGGYLNAAVDVCDMFVENGVIVSTRGRDRRVRQEYHADSGALFDPDKPMAVLVNTYSASASEIVAACLQDHNRASVVGVRSWGKGTVQNIVPLENGRSALKITTATYWRPSGKNIHRHKDTGEEGEWGVSPDPGLKVELTDEEREMAVKHRRRRDIVSGRPFSVGATGKEENNDDSEDTDSDDSEDADAEAKKSEEAWKTFDDPQLRRAIEHIERQIVGVG